MITKRIIPCLDVRSGRVVKGTNFEGIRDVADPVEMARMYNAAGADELVFYDITASFEGRTLFTDILTRVASEVFIPLTVGGGINTLEDFDRVLKCGADKVSVNSGALRDPDLIPTAGVEKQSEDGRYSANGYNVYCNLDALTATLKRVFRNKAIPGQPTTSNGKPYKDLFYSVLKVNVDDIDNMIAVQEQIQALGYEASSNIEWIESTQKQYANIQAMLGGIGAISLLVAAIGITNTMMMSIYERTKEIGVMKVLGCDMRNIQAMFLMEAADIGLVGGIVGLGISYLISMIINKVVAASGNMSSLSYIPLWLAGASVIFAVVIGMAAGYFPSKRAMKLSPLAAIRNE